MKSRISTGLVMMLAAMLMSFVPAATLTTQRAAASSSCDWAQFVADVTVADGTTFAPGAAFTKTWRLKNIGTCTWSTSYSLVFDTGDKMSGPSSVNLPSSVAPGQTVDLSLNLTAPGSAGHYRGYWKFKNASGVLFGIGSTASSSWWVDINVSGTSTGVAYDFAANYCSAAWYSLQGSLPCPGTDGDSRGFVLQVSNPQLENGSASSGLGLITMPQNAYNGDIHGSYPAFHVQSGDHFQSIINCAFGATSCYVTFRLDYQIGSGPINTFWTFREKYDGLFFHADVDLSPLAGQDVKFILTALANGSAAGDRALWVNPIIARGNLPPPPPSNCTDRAQFVADVTVPDGTVFSPGTAFTKTWRLKNVGTCTWTTSYSMVFDSGDKMSGPDSVGLLSNVAPGQTVDMTVNLTAPNVGGSYRGFWKFRNANGFNFGIGSSATQSWWVDIRVSGTAAGRNYDFGTSTSPLAAGYVRVTETTAFTSGGYGWTDTSTLESRDRGGPTDDLKRDFVMDSSAARTFRVDLPNGTYAVTVTMGDNGFAHDNMIVKANGATMLGNVNNAVGSFSVNTFNVNVTSSSLALEFSDGGGSDPTWVVNGVSIASVSQPPAACDRAQFVADVTVPDGTTYTPGAVFTKTWRLKNVGTCTWTTSYAMVFDTGDKMSGPDAVNLPNNVTPGQTVDMSVNLTAPSVAGSYRGYWKFRNASGVNFGIGSDGTKSWWVDIRVSGVGPTPPPITVTPGPSPTPVAGVAYDFAANACSAVWVSAAVTLPNHLPCPGTDGDARGFILKLTNPQLENGNVYSGMGLLTFPQNVFNGYIQGIFPPYHVRAGDRFRSIVNCSYGATSCYVVFRLDYQTGNGPITTFWAFVEKYEGQYYQADLDLSPLVGQDVKFILTVLATGSPTDDRALWVAPVIFNGGALPPTPTGPSPTPSAVDTSNWTSYQNVKYGFSFKFPPGSSVASQSDNGGRVYLPLVTAGTNLHEKYIDVSVVEGANPCKSPNTNPMVTSQNVTINNISFLQETGSDGAAGNFYDWTAYSTLKGNACISLTFILHSVNPGNYQTPPPVFNKAAESAIFSTVMSTFALFTSAASATNTPPAATATTAAPTPTTGMAMSAVSISNFSFNPASLQVPVGTMVTWTNNDSTAHTVTSNTSVFDSGTLPVGSSFSFTFTQTGTFAYHCNIHPTMTGTITVVP